MNIQYSLKDVVKRDGSVISFDPQRIYDAIKKAVLCLGGTDFARVEFLTQEVTRKLERKYTQPSVEDVQDVVEEVLMNNGHSKTAKLYILYRQKRKEVRDEKTKILDGKATQLPFSLTALNLLKKRYLQQQKGVLAETPEELFLRVARAVASSDAQYGVDPLVSEQEFYECMAGQYFLPNSPTLVNAGIVSGQLLSGYAVPLHDSIKSIMTGATQQALIQKSGAGTGFNFSRIRPRGDLVRERYGIASGPVPFMKIFNTVGGSIVQGGVRKGANMGILRVDHPDILSFIAAKQDGSLENFNISVGITDEFMDAVLTNGEFTLRHPTTKEPVQTLKARHMFDLIISTAWRNGDPGVLFFDSIMHSRAHPLFGVKDIEATSACAETPLYAHEGSMVGAINLSKFFVLGTIDWQHLKEVVKIAVRFLDNALDASEYPVEECAIATKQTRRIGLGVMGFADLLFQLEIPYDSEDAVALARLIMKTISETADAASADLAQKRGAFAYFSKSIYRNGIPLRNASRTTISPTGCMSLLADCSPAIDPVFALSYKQRFFDKEITIVNPHFEEAAQKLGIYSETLVDAVAQAGSLKNVHGIPDRMKSVFKVAFEISPEWHLRMQAAFQEFTDNAISKTINFPSWATTRDVEHVFLLAHKLGCKGITIYRDQSKQDQVISVSIEKEMESSGAERFYCPECKAMLIDQESTLVCKQCGFAKSRV